MNVHRCSLFVAAGEGSILYEQKSKERGINNWKSFSFVCSLPLFMQYKWKLWGENRGKYTKNSWFPSRMSCYSSVCWDKLWSVACLWKFFVHRVSFFQVLDREISSLEDVYSLQRVSWTLYWKSFAFWCFLVFLSTYRFGQFGF